MTKSTLTTFLAVTLCVLDHSKLANDTLTVKWLLFNESYTSCCSTTGTSISYGWRVQLVWYWEWQAKLKISSEMKHNLRYNKVLFYFVADKENVTET
jgi:hypothetical protein